MQIAEKVPVARGAKAHGALLTVSKPRVAWTILLAAALGFVAAGAYAIVRGLDARNEVRAQLVAERITTPEDASIPNAPVTDHRTAHAQADIIRTHMLEATGGKTYAELDREDPLRQVAFTASALRASLMSAALAWHVADLAVGVGLFMVGIGALMLIGLALIRPARPETA